MDFSLCEPEIPMKHLDLFCSSLKRRKKANITAVGRGKGRGRAKCQLRRSGVCQTKCRKKQYTTINIQDETLEDFEVYDTVQNDYLLNSSNSLDYINEYDIVDMAEFVDRWQLPSSSPVNFTFSDASNEEKTEMHDNENKLNSKVKQETLKCLTKTCISDSLANIDRSYNNELEKNALQLHSLLERSIESEDSFCIVFEDECDANNGMDVVDYDQISWKSESEDDEKLRPQKVKFNLIPEVHTMIKWDYAYRAARKGPWEEMARDRERFKNRINCTAAILNPILTSQHRIWQERYTLK